MVTWTQADVTAPGRRPGTYINFQSRATGLITGGLTGVVAATVKAAWGDPDKIYTIRSQDDVRKYFSNSEEIFNTTLPDVIGNVYNAPYILNNMLAGGVRTILARRLVGPAATGNTGKSGLTLVDNASTGVIIIYAKYPGRHGDTFTAQVSGVPGATTQQIVLRDNDGDVVGTWVSTVNVGTGSGIVDDLIEVVNGDVNNDYVTVAKLADGSGTLATVTATNLAGGDGDEENIVLGDYQEAQTAFELENFEWVYFDTDDSTIKASCRTWVLRQRNQGNKILYMTGSSLAETDAQAKVSAQIIEDHSVHYIYPGSKQDNLAGDEVTYPGYLFAARIIGSIAGLRLTESPTFLTVSGVNDLEKRLSGVSVEDVLASGVMPIVWDGARYKIERGINTLIPVNFASYESEPFQKVKIVRILDNTHNVIKKSSDDTLVGKILNNENGRRNVISLFDAFMSSQVLAGLWEEGYVVRLDPDNAPSGDRFFVSIGGQPIDSAEFIYFTVNVG